MEGSNMGEQYPYWQIHMQTQNNQISDEIDQNSNFKCNEYWL